MSLYIILFSKDWWFFVILNNPLVSTIKTKVLLYSMIFYRLMNWFGKFIGINNKKIIKSIIKKKPKPKPLTCQCPFTSAMWVTTVIQNVGIMSGSICCPKLKKRLDLGVKGIKGQSTCRVVTTVCLNHVICKKSLDGIKHASRPQI